MAVQRWIIPEKNDNDAIQKLAGETGHGGLVCAVLSSRGLEPDEARAFFDSDRMDSPFTLIDMDKAVERIREAIDSSERIAVYGDYDCDGITSTALLTGYLQSCGADVIYYVPSREKEGYGLNNAAIDILHEQNTGLIVTVDNGISAHTEINYANSLGIDVVVTDHHTPKSSLPNAIAVVNPRRKDCPSRYKDLAGVGVAFKLVCALEDADCSELLEYYSELAALGTIADVVPLTDENRVMAKHGLKQISESHSPGIRALLDEAGLTGRDITGESASFGLIPRINASGRMGIADNAIELLLTDDDNYARELAGIINVQNAERKKVEEKILAGIDSIITEDAALLSRRIFVAAGEGWHHGVVGIAAAKMLERYGKPSLLFAMENGVARASGRSLEGFSLIEAISSCSEKLTRYGGHKLAAGLTIETACMPAFIDEVEQWAGENYPVMPVPSLRIDHIISPKELMLQNVRELSVLEPFGAGNEAPVFLLPGAIIEGIRPTSDGKHIRIRLRYGNHLFYAVYFNMTEAALPFFAGDAADTAAAISASEWNGSQQLSVRIVGMRPPGMDQEKLISSYSRYMNHLRGEYGSEDMAALAPGREDIALVYRAVKKLITCPDDGEALYYRLYNTGIDYCKMRVALDILAEMGLIEKSAGQIELVDNAPKVDLADSAILAALNGRDAVTV